MKKLVSLVLVAVLMLTCVALAEGAVPSPTVKDLLSLETSSLYGTEIVLSDVDAEVAATLEQEALALDGVDPSFTLKEAFGIATENFAANDSCMVKFEMVSPFADDEPLNVAVKADADWTLIPAVAENGKVIAYFNAAVLEAINNASESYIAFLSK